MRLQRHSGGFLDFRSCLTAEDGSAPGSRLRWPSSSPGPTEADPVQRPLSPYDVSTPQPAYAARARRTGRPTHLRLSWHNASPVRNRSSGPSDFRPPRGPNWQPAISARRRHFGWHRRPRLQGAESRPRRHRGREPDLPWLLLGRYPHRGSLVYSESCASTSFRQLMDVLVGKMSLVGSRPLNADEHARVQGGPPPRIYAPVSAPN